MVDEPLRTQQLIEHDTEVMTGAPVAVQEDRSVILERTDDCLHAHAHERQVARHAGPAVFVGCLERRLRLPSVEGRIEIRQVEASMRNRLQDFQAIAADELLHGPITISSWP